MSAFLLLGAGILCAVFVLLLEHLYVMFLRDRLMSSRHRKKLMSILYPFSLVSTTTLFSKSIHLLQLLTNTFESRA